MSAPTLPPATGAPAAAPPVTRTTRLSYGIGQTGAQIFRDTPAVLLPVFMTTLLGVPAWLSGIVVLVPKLWLILCDPLMGAWSDRVKPQRGRSPFLVIGALLTGLGFVGLFSFTGFSSPYMAALAIGALFFLASTAFSAYSVPYLAIASELAGDPHERTRILTWRMACSVLGVILSVGLAQPIVFRLGGGPEAWRTMAVLLGGVALAAMLATPLGLRRQLRPRAHAASRMSWGQGLRAAWRNKPFVLITATHFIQAAAQACGYTVVGFIFIYAVQKVNLLLPFILCMSAGTVISQPFWLKLSQRVGKRRAFVFASLGWVAVTVTWLGVGPGSDVLFTLPGWGPVATEHVWVMARALVIGITNSGFVLLTLSLLTDTITAARQQADAVDEGLLSGIFTALEKMAFALGPLIAGFVLSAAGFQSSVKGVVPQTDGAILGMVLVYSLIPAALVVASLGLFRLYQLELASPAAPR